MPVSGRHLARRCAVQALYQWSITGQPADEIESSFIHNSKLKGKHLDYFRQLIKQIPLKVDQLDEHLTKCVDRDLNRIDELEKAILRVGCYEMIYESLAPAIAINEAVDIAKGFCSEHGYKYVNGVLDKLALDPGIGIKVKDE